MEGKRAPLSQRLLHTTLSFPQKSKRARAQVASMYKFIKKRSNDAYKTGSLFHTHVSLSVLTICVVSIFILIVHFNLYITHPFYAKTYSNVSFLFSNHHICNHNSNLVFSGPIGQLTPNTSVMLYQANKFGLQAL